VEDQLTSNMKNEGSNPAPVMGRDKMVEKAMTGVSFLSVCCIICHVMTVVGCAPDSTVVEQATPNPKNEGSNPAPDMGRDKKVEKVVAVKLFIALS